ncbi:MAG: gfo/Idh/MocA family oxidoreductase, partial [Verrucomicrobiales bacterium]
WNPDVEQPIDFYENWSLVPNAIDYDNAFKIQWEEFLRHVTIDTPWHYTLREGARGVQLAELGMRSWEEKRWVEVDLI